MLTSDEVASKLSCVFTKFQEHIVFAYLFGSVAIGTQSALSDVDLAIYVSNTSTFSFSDKLLIHADCCRRLNRDDLDLVVVNQMENLMLLDQIVREGKVIFDSDPDCRMFFEAESIHKAYDFKFQRHREMGF